MLSNKDINFNDETQVLTINGEKHPIGEAIAAKIGDISETGLTGDTVAAQLVDLVSGKVDRFISNASATVQNINVGTDTTSNRMFLLSAGYSGANANLYAFGLVFISYDGNI